MLITDARRLLYDAQRALGMLQGDLADKLGASRRTSARWSAGESTPGHHQYQQLARMLLPVDPVLAAKAATAGGTTLDALAPGAQPAQVKRSYAVNAVVCAAADAMDASPRVLRPALLAAFRSAQEMGLDIETVVAELEAALEPPTAKARKR